MPQSIPLPQQLPTRPPSSTSHTRRQLHQPLDISRLVPLLSSCAVHRDASTATAVHARVIKSGVHDSDAYLRNALLDTYAKCGLMDDAAQLFDNMPHRDAVSWTAMLSGLCRNGDPMASLSLFAAMLERQETEDDQEAVRPNEFTVAAVARACAATRGEALARAVHGYAVATGLALDPFVTGSLVDMYAKMGAVAEAEALVMTGASPSAEDVVSWTSLVSGCVTAGTPEQALSALSRMLKAGVRPNLVTMLSAVRAASLAGNPGLFGPVHSLVVKLGLEEDVLLGASLLEMYARNGFPGEGSEIFSRYFLSYERRPDPEVLSVLLHACSLSGCLDLGEQLHGCFVKQGPLGEGTLFLENSLIDMYAKNEKPELAVQVFSAMGVRDIASWNTMIACHAKGNRAEEALQLLARVHRSNGLAPDFATLISSINACSELASLSLGQVLHGYAVRAGFTADVFISNALLDMYGKAGAVNMARSLFDEMSTKDLCSWNSMIAAYGAHGEGNLALAVFHELERRHRPNAVSFTNVLSSCAHSGLVAEGMECFSRMMEMYGIEPVEEHYACFVDLLGRSGRLQEATDFIGRMPVEPGPAIWRVLLAACALCGDVEVAEMAAERLLALDPSCSACRVAQANVYAAAGKWEMAAKVRAEARGEGAGLTGTGSPAWSVVELGAMESVGFVAADTSHPESDRIYEVIAGMKLHSLDDYSISC